MIGSIFTFLTSHKIQCYFLFWDNISYLPLITRVYVIGKELLIHINFANTMLIFSNNSYWWFLKSALFNRTIIERILGDNFKLNYHHINLVHLPLTRRLLIISNMLNKAYYLTIWKLLPIIENRIHAFVLCTKNSYNACVNRYSIAGSSCETQLNNVFYCVNAVFSITYKFDILILCRGFSLNIIWLTFINILLRFKFDSFQFPIIPKAEITL